MGAQVKMGIMGIVFGVLLLLVGLTFGTSLIIDQVNRQGGKIGCFDGDDILISNAVGPNTATIAKAATARTTPVPQPGSAIPKKTGPTYQGNNVAGKACGVGATVVQEANGGSDTPAWTSPTCTGDNCGTIRYTLEVFGADSLNNLMTLAFWIVLIMIAISLIGAGGYAVRGALQ